MTADQQADLQCRSPTNLHSYTITHMDCQENPVEQTNCGVIMQSCYQADQGLCCSK